MRKHCLCGDHHVFVRRVKRICRDRPVRDAGYSASDGQRVALTFLAPDIRPPCALIRRGNGVHRNAKASATLCWISRRMLGRAVPTTIPASCEPGQGRPDPQIEMFLPAASRNRTLDTQRLRGIARCGIRLRCIDARPSSNLLLAARASSIVRIGSSLHNRFCPVWPHSVPQDGCRPPQSKNGCPCNGHVTGCQKRAPSWVEGRDIHLAWRTIHPPSNTIHHAGAARTGCKIHRRDPARAAVLDRPKGQMQRIGGKGMSST